MTGGRITFPKHRGNLFGSLLVRQIASPYGAAIIRLVQNTRNERRLMPHCVIRSSIVSRAFAGTIGEFGICHQAFVFTTDGYVLLN
jgi:hypothetical protein